VISEARVSGGSADLENRIKAALSLSEYADHPLTALLEELMDAYDHKQRELSKLVRISDGFHHITRDSFDDLVRKSDRQARQLEKLIRISDRYQNSLHEMRAALEQAALTDTLTGIGNRRYLLQRLSEENERARRSGSQFGVILFDLDHFKRCNDTWCHEFGDQVLRAVARVMIESSRTCDLYGRWGGEEFIFILPNTDGEATAQMAERQRAAIEGIRFEPPHDALRITASFGAAAWREDEDVDSLLRRTDNRMYAAKKGGRNRVVSSEEGSAQN